MSDDLLIKYLLKETSLEENAEVTRWLVADPENQKEFLRFELIWNESKKLELKSKADPDEAWEDFQKRIPENRPKAIERSIHSKLTWLKVAAVLFILTGAAWSFYRIQLNAYDTISSGKTVLTEVLPDGSNVTLNKNAVLSYKKDFKGNTRSVRLEEGEVFFDISRDKTKPFIIDVDEVSIRVLGTAFNVKQKDNFTEIIVERGLVRVSRNNQQVDLSKGEKLIVRKDEAEFHKELNKDQLYNYYRTKIFSADNTPLWRMVEILNEAYQSDIIIDNPELRDLPLNTTFKNESLDTILLVIAETFEIKVVREGEKILLK